MISRSAQPLGPRLAAARELPLRAVAVVGLVLLAYNYSLLTLARGLSLQTPLAYLGLVPLMALGLAVVRLRTEPAGLPIHDRQLDWIVGLGLLGIVAAILILLPDPTSSTFWLRRIDLLTLPLFVAGLIALLFGVRRMWSLKWPIAFLLLAWPVPYTLFLAAAVGQFTEFTAHLVAAVHPGHPDRESRGLGRDPVLRWIGRECVLGQRRLGLLGREQLRRLPAHRDRTLVRRARARSCDGSHGSPPASRLIFALNVGRIVAILAVGAGFGQDAAINALHPFAGLVVFNIGVLAMVALVPRFGLRFIGASDRPGGTGTASRQPRSSGPPGLLGDARPGRRPCGDECGLHPVRGDLLRIGRRSPHELRRPGDGPARVGITVHLRVSPGAQYFGSSATWDRISYWSTPDAALTSTRSVYVDVITTDDPGSFADYGLQACYRFHGYDIASVTTADIGAGVHAQIINYVNTKHNADWSALWWEWPYTADGLTRYERVVVLMGEGPKAEFTGVTATDVQSPTPRFAGSDQFLVTLGRAIVRSQLTTASR